MIAVGIDPGLDGAIAALTIGGNVLFLEDTPTMMTRGREYDVVGMKDILERCYEYDAPIRIYLENVHAFPIMGKKANFGLGKSLGVWMGIVTTMGIPLEYVTPQAWTKEILAGLRKGKDSHILRARQLFPDLAEKLLKSKDGRADALLIAEYGRRRL